MSRGSMYLVFPGVLGSKTQIVGYRRPLYKGLAMCFVRKNRRKQRFTERKIKLKSSIKSIIKKNLYVLTDMQVIS